MKTSNRHFALGALATLVVIALVPTVAAVAGLYSFAADEEHSQPVSAMIDYARDRAVQVRAASIEAPASMSAQGRIAKGAGNYEAMCAQCHLAPLLEETELSRGLYPRPPNLTKEAVAPAAAFWTIKHGIKASGMPAWGRSMTDDDIWSLVAFLQQLPQLNAASYRQLVNNSEGHSHSGLHSEEGTQAHDHGGKLEGRMPQQKENDGHGAPVKNRHQDAHQ